MPSKRSTDIKLRNAAPLGARPIRNAKSKNKNKQRGAAFLIAIAILVILVAIGTTFFSVSRLELKTATNVGNTVRVDLLNDAANAIAIHHLNQYFLRSPEVTSQDHSFKSLFNGSAFAGKSWARRKEPTPVNPNPIVGKSMLQAGLPEVDINRIQSAIDQAAASITGANGRVVLYWPEDGHKEELFRGPRSNNWLYIPRFQTATALDNPFAPVTPDHILLYDYEGNVEQIRLNPPADTTPRTIELRIEDGSNAGLGSLVASTPDDLDALNNALAGLGTFADDVRLYYFSDMDPNNTGDPAERSARYSFVTAAIYKENGLDDNATDNSIELDDYGSNPLALFDLLATGYPEEQLDAIGDIDNDGDGFADSIWLPIPEDVFLASDQIDNDLDGMIDETQDNGINEDGDRIIDINGVDLGPRTDYADPLRADGSPPESPDGIIAHDEDEAIEAGALVYNGLGPLVELDSGFERVGDGLDNDANGLVDEPAEDRLFLTSPLPGVRVPLDLDGDGATSTIENYRPYNPVNDSFPAPAYQVLNPALIIAPSITVTAINPATGAPQAYLLSNADVDAIDNDYDLLLNDYFAYGYIGPYNGGLWLHTGNWPGGTAPYARQVSKSYNDLSRDVWGVPGSFLTGTALNPDSNGIDIDWPTALANEGLEDLLLASLRITHSGEPVCNLVGRAAIEINDEASKVNLNVAGAESFNPFPVPEPEYQGPMLPAFAGGLSPAEYDLATLPKLGSNSDQQSEIVSRIAGFRTGGPQGKHLPRDSNQAAADQVLIGTGLGDTGALTGLVGNDVLDYAYDVSLPGLGRMDDNGNALIAALDGLDNDGNGLTDEGFLSPLDLPNNYDEVLAYRDGDITHMELPRDPDDGYNNLRFTDPAQLAFARRWFRIGSFEGIDEPGERQTFNPLRNILAESDSLDNEQPFTTADIPGFTDDIGELGDRVFQNDVELRGIYGVQDTADRWERLTTLHSTDRNVSFIPTEVGIRALNKTDLNRASAKQLAAKLLLSSDVPSALKLIDRQEPFGILDNAGLSAAAAFPGIDSPFEFAQGLRQADTRLIAHDPNNGDGGDPLNPVRGGFLFHRSGPGQLSLSGATELPLDQQLEFLQLAVNIADARDSGHARSELTTERTDLVQKSATELGLADLFPSPLPPLAEFNANNAPVQNWPVDPSVQEQVDQDNLFPLEEIQNHLEDVMNLAAGQRTLQITDDWWTQRVTSNSTYPIGSNSPADLIPEQRHISYTAAGVESIRINELMVRPVRRVEAEAFPDQTVNTDSDPIVDPLPAADRRNLDPTPFAESQIEPIGNDITEDLPAVYPHPTGGGVTKEYVNANAATGDPVRATIDSLMPEFSVERQVLDVAYATGGLDTGLDLDVSPYVVADPYASLNDSDWRLSSQSGGVLGESSVMSTSGLPIVARRSFETPDGEAEFLVPDVMEFIFTEANSTIVGLPSGRYYLAVKLEDADDSFKQVVASGRLRYAVKYHDLSAPRTIIKEIADKLDDIDSESTQAQQQGAYQDYVDYFQDNFKVLPANHMANGPGEPSGWVFLDATPGAVSGVNPPDGDYFTDFPPAYSMTYTFPTGDTLNARVSVEFIDAGSWRLVVTTAELPPLGVPVTATLSGGTISVTQTYTPTLNPNEPQPSFVLETNLTDAQLRSLMDGNFTLQISGAIPATQTIQRKAVLADFETTHAISIPPNSSEFAVSVALTTSPLPARPSPGIYPEPTLAEGLFYRFTVIDTNSDSELTLTEVQNVYPTAVVGDITPLDTDGNGTLSRLDLVSSSAIPLSTASIGVNYFDFSQEPDHEYIELANVSDDEIDLSNWLLEVGPKQSEGMPYAPFTTQWRVPQNTFISPGGMLLLTFNKFDRFDTPPLPNEDNLINHNGLGMAASDRDSLANSSTVEDISRVTVPPIGDNSSNPYYDPTLPLSASNAPIYDPAASHWFDPTGSVFARLDDPDTGKNEFRDYVDDYGAGVTTNYFSSMNPASPLLRIDPTQPDKGIVPDQTRARVEADFTSSGGEPENGGSPVPNYPWDRIIELQNLRLWQRNENFLDPTTGGNVYTMDDINDVDMLARFVLRGGVLPNYPERDGIDNDGDGGFIDQNGDYRLGILETDMLDNDLNGFTDERVQNVDLDGDGVIDLPLWPFSSEGVDEGNLGLLRRNNLGAEVPYRNYGPGSFEAGTLPTIYNDNRAVQQAFFVNPATNIPNTFVLGTDVLDYDPLAAPAPIVPIGALPTLNGGAANPLVTDAYIPLSRSVIRGSLYELVVDVTTATAGLVRVGVSGSPATQNISTSGVFTFVFTAVDTTDQLRVISSAASNITIASVEINELVPSNAPGQSLAVGITNLAYIQDVAGNANQLYGTTLGQRYGTEPDLATAGGLPAGEDAMYLGSDLDPPDWKAFNERRMNPGDNVIVSLYDAAGEVADRVTYRENDVVNRTIDDVVGSPYFVAGGYNDYLTTEGVENEVAVNALDEYVSLHPDYPSFWLPNQMGLDFYRSLERKHTLAPGDRFGTQNRWQATDGNYDDWADSISLFARTSRIDGDSYEAAPYLTAAQGDYGATNVNSFLELSRLYSSHGPAGDRFSPGYPNTEDMLRLFGHAIWGTPLRMNTAMRKVANPVDPLRVFDPAMAVANTNGLAGPLGVSSAVGYTDTQRISQFISPIDSTPVARGGGTGDDVPNTLWQQRMAEQRVTNAPYNAPIDLGQVPHLIFEHGMLNVARAVDPGRSYLHDPMRINFITNSEDFYNDITQRSALASHAEALTAGAERPLTALLNAGATDSLTLTVAQANFVPITPDLEPSGLNQIDQFLPSGTSVRDLLLWQYPNGWPDSASAEPPAAWSPVFLFGDPEEVDKPQNYAVNGALDFRKLPFYARAPLYPGSVPNQPKVDGSAFLFEDDFLFSGPDWQRAFYPFLPSGNTSAPLVAGAPQQVLRRWPLDKRVVMYVSKPRNQSPGIAMPDQFRPEALWVWDAEDGLENGEYEVYIGTWLPGLSKALTDLASSINAVAAVEPELLANLSAPSTTFPVLNPVSATIANGIITQFALNQIALRDPVRYADTVSGSPFKAEYEIDVLTDPTNALGYKNDAGDAYGLMPSAQWNPNVTYKANEAGYIFYGSDSASGWQPIIVRVTDNFLALRVRHAGTAYQTGAISHIVLSPRKRTPGRINLNTAQFQVAQGESGRLTLTHPLAGLPGILNLGGEFGVPITTGNREEVTLPVTTPYTPGSGPLPEPYEMELDGTLRLGNIQDPTLGVYGSMPPGPNSYGLLSFTRDPDSGQLDSVQGTLASTFNGVDLNDNNEYADALHRAMKGGRYLMLSMLQAGRTEYQDGRYYKSTGDLLSDDAAFGIPGTSYVLHPLSNNSDAEQRNVEVEERLRRIANSVSVRSDVFEIITTVQSGYGIDADGNGHYDYRDNREFITTAETRSRLVYERRAPADNSDETDVSTQ